MAADVVGALLIVFVVPLAWSTRLIVLAVYLGVVERALAPLPAPLSRRLNAWDFR